VSTILNLPGWDVTKVDQSEHDYRVEARFTVEPPTCIHCGKGKLFGSLYRHGTRPQLLMDLPVHGKRVGIVVKRVRYRCQDCKKTFLQPLPDMHAGGSMTNRLALWVAKESLRRTFVSIAHDVGVDEKTVRNLFKTYTAGLAESTIFATPEWMGLDEIHLLKKPRCVVTNVKESTIIEVMSNRNKATVSAYLKRLPDKQTVKVVTMDMWGAYRDAVEKWLPDADVVVDKFHVVRMATAAVDAVRKSIRSELSVGQRRRMMRSRFVLLKRLADLDDDSKAILDAWSRQFPTLGTAHRLKEEFHDIFGLPTREQARLAYHAWEASIPKELMKPFQPLRTAVTNWRTEIFNYFDHKATNALTEALNGVAKGIQRTGRGYSFPAIRARMLYSRHLHKTRPRYGEDWDKGVMAQVVQAPPPEVDLSELHYAPMPAAPEPSLGVDIQRLLWEVSTPGAFGDADPE
jgi:transposase